ncbi:hypothetical protein OHJ21_18250 [Virgibacillus sp. LDC1]|nr:hypothetical protein [Virgibacillus sp. LDC1]
MLEELISRERLNIESGFNESSFMQELRRVNVGGSDYVSFLQSLLSPNFRVLLLRVEIRLQRRPLRFSGIDSSSPLLRSRTD